MSKRIHWSALKHIGKSPAHYRAYLTKPFKATPAMLQGSLAHALVLGGTGRFVCYRDGARNERHKKYQDFLAENEGKEILSPTEWTNAEILAKALESSPQAMELIADGAHEERLYWQIAGRECAGTPDVLGKGMTDLKFTQSADPRWFYRHAKRSMQWHAQLAWYENGAVSAGKPKPERVSIIAVETEGLPHFVPPPVVYDLTESCIDEGHRVWRSMWERLVQCEENDYWPGYTEHFQTLDADPEEFSVVVDGEEISL